MVSTIKAYANPKYLRNNRWTTCLTILKQQYKSQKYIAAGKVVCSVLKISSYLEHVLQYLTPWKMNTTWEDELSVLLLKTFLVLHNAFPFYQSLRVTTGLLCNTLIYVEVARKVLSYYLMYSTSDVFFHKNAPSDECILRWYILRELTLSVFYSSIVSNGTTDEKN